MASHTEVAQLMRHGSADRDLPAARDLELRPSAWQIPGVTIPGKPALGKSASASRRESRLTRRFGFRCSLVTRMIPFEPSGHRQCRIVSANCHTIFVAFCNVLCRLVPSSNKNMATIHFLNVLEGDCNIIEHDSGRITVIDVSNASNGVDTSAETMVKASAERKAMKARTMVPVGKKDYRQKHSPDNPIEYLRDELVIDNIFRFVITHPDMDHIDGIRDLYDEFTVVNTWDTDNNKEISTNGFFAGYNREDWEFYKILRDGNFKETSRHTFFDTSDCDYWKSDDMKVLCPSKELVVSGNSSGEIHDSSYVILFSPPRSNGRKWKILFAGDSHDNSWEHILKNNAGLISNVDVLFAPHHGRDSSRSYEFLKTLKPRLTLFGNASSEHLAYSSYPEIRITNNQAGFIILETSPDSIKVYVKNQEFARDFRSNPKRGWGDPVYHEEHNAYFLFQFTS